MDLPLSRLHSSAFSDTERLVAFLNKTEGRDKATKALQYGCRLLAWASSNSKISEKFASLC
ncbi:peroxisomal biogenesis factor 11 domain-containing protein, putative, partial [Eimeria tenella]